MARMIFVNLPVRDLPRAKEFFVALGFHFEPRFTNDAGACLVIEEGSIHAMLLTEPFFKGFLTKPMADAREATEVLIALSAESREAVDAMLGKALAAGGTEPRAAQDHGFMYARCFEDLDSHVWEIVWMDPNANPCGG
jgi:uncharacterized protein